MLRPDQGGLAGDWKSPLKMRAVTPAHILFPFTLPYLPFAYHFSSLPLFFMPLPDFLSCTAKAIYLL
jgi:hypothetical protein